MALIKSTKLQTYFDTPMSQRTDTQRNEAWAAEWQGNADEWRGMKNGAMADESGAVAPIYDERVKFCEDEAVASLAGQR